MSSPTTMAVHIAQQTVLQSLQPKSLIAFLILCISLQLLKMIYRANIHPLRSIPGPWLPASSTIWIRWQRWNGRLSLSADKLLTRYGPIVRIAPNIVLLNDRASVEKIFVRRDLDTSPTSIRALRVGGHDWTVTYPQHGVARERRHPVMIASTTSSLKMSEGLFMKNIEGMVRDLGVSKGERSEDIVRHLRICTLKNTQPLIGGMGVDLEEADVEEFPHVVGEYNFLVVWRLCLPEWMFSWLQYCGALFEKASFRVKSSEKLFDLGAVVRRQAEKYQQRSKDQENKDESDVPPSFYSLCTDSSAKYPMQQQWTPSELSAEIAGQILAATETTSSALAFILYELAKNQPLLEALYEELTSSQDTRTVQQQPLFEEPTSQNAEPTNSNNDNEIDSLPLLDACIQEGLRFRPPVALTGSRLTPKGGLTVLGHYIPAGTVITTQSLSASRQNPALFPDAEVYNPMRWLESPELRAARRKFLVPFGVGARRCPGGNMALYQMRRILEAVVRDFKVRVARETTEEVMEPFEANGYRSRHDRCDLVFEPRTSWQESV